MGTVTEVPISFEGLDPAIAKRLEAIIIRIQQLEEERDQLNPPRSRRRGQPA